MSPAKRTLVRESGSVMPPLFLKTSMARPIAPGSGVCAASDTFLGDHIVSPRNVSEHRHTFKHFWRVLQLVRFDRYFFELVPHRQPESP